jgi:hypothetical protein
MRTEDSVRFMVVLFLAFVSGCDGNTPTHPDAAFLRFTPDTLEPGAAESASADAGPGQIAIHATFAGPDPCRTISADLEQAGRELTVRVSIRPTGGPCILIVGRFAYDALIEGLAPGRYALQVVHVYPSTGWPASL